MRIDDVDIERTDEEKELKRKELNLVVPNSFTQEGTPLPTTASKGNLAQKTDSVKKIINSSVSR